MLTCSSGLHPRGLGHLFLRGPGFNTQSAYLSRKFTSDMAVTSMPQAMPPQHLWDQTKGVQISRWHYKTRECPYGQCSLYRLKICGLCGFLCVNTLYIFSPLTLALHFVHLIPNFIPLHCGNWGAFGLSFYFIKSIGNWKARHQQEAPGASRSRIQNKHIKNFISESCSNFLPH